MFDFTASSGLIYSKRPSEQLPIDAARLIAGFTLHALLISSFVFKQSSGGHRSPLASTIDDNEKDCWDQDFLA
jgi:hypothetical protein